MPAAYSKMAMAMKTTKYQLTPFEVGQVKAHLEHGLSAAEMSRRILKPDGKSKYGETAMSNCIKKLQEQPHWRGERQKGSARPRKTTAEQDKDIVRYLFKQRGEEKVFVSKLKKHFVFLRKLFD